MGIDIMVNHERNWPVVSAGQAQILVNGQELNIASINLCSLSIFGMAVPNSMKVEMRFGR